MSLIKALISAYYFVFFVAMAATAPFLSLFLKTRGVDGTQIGLILSAGSVASILVQPALGLVNDRARDPRRIILFSAILSPICYAGYFFCRGFWALAVVSVSVSVVSSAAPIMDAIAIRQGEQSGFSYGHVRLWGAVGYALGTFVSAYAYNLYGDDKLFIVYGALSLIVVVTILRLPKTESVRPTKEAFVQGLLNVASRRSLLAFIMICTLMSIAQTINWVYLPLYYQELHYPMAWFGLNFTAAAAIEVPLFYVSGRIMSRYGKMRVLIVGALCYTVKYGVMVLAPSAGVVIAVQLLDGVGFSLYWSAAVQLVADLAPSDRQATAQTLFGALASGLSSVIGTAAGGFILDRFGPSAVFAVATVLAATAVVCFGWFARLTSVSIRGLDDGERYLNV